MDRLRLLRVFGYEMKIEHVHKSPACAEPPTWLNKPILPVLQACACLLACRFYMQHRHLYGFPARVAAVLQRVLKCPASVVQSHAQPMTVGKGGGCAATGEFCAVTYVLAHM